MDGNPLYRPMEGRFYSITDLHTNTDFEHFSLGEEFGFGITDRMSVFLNTAGSYDSSDHPRHNTKYNWDNFGIGMSFRLIDNGPWVGDVYGKVQQQYDTSDGVETDWYNWTVGTTVGFVGWNRWTVGFTAELNYLKDDIDNYDYDALGMRAGVGGLFNFTQNWNIVGALYYDFNLSDTYYHNNPVSIKLGANYNFDSWKYVGLYIEKNVKEDFDDAPMVFGAKFGIDF